MPGDGDRGVHGFPGLAAPSGARNYYPGLFRGFIEDVNDPEMRKRVKVRVIGVHPDELDAEYLPWAEVMGVSASLAGDFFPWSKDDRVWVQFEGGDRRLPVVTGSWVARPAGLNDVPSDVTVDYARTQRRWTRVDRVGNSITMSELPEEEFLVLKSGAAAVVLDQKDGSVTMRSGSGAVRMEGNSVEADVLAYFITSEQVIISAEAKSALTPSAILQLMSDFELNLHAGDKVSLGGYLPRFKGAPGPAVPGMEYKQSPQVDVVARQVTLGSPAGRVLSGVPVPETESVVAAGVEVVIEAKPATNKPSGVTVRVFIDADGDITIKSTTKVSVEAPNVEVTGTGDVSVTADNVEVTATTEAKVQAPQITLQGNTIDLTSTTQINMT